MVVEQGAEVSVRRAAAAVEEGPEASGEAVPGRGDGFSQVRVSPVGLGEIGGRLLLEIGIEDDRAEGVAAVVAAEVEDEVFDALLLDPEEARIHEFPKLIHPVVINEGLDGHDGRLPALEDLEGREGRVEISEDGVPDRLNVGGTEVGGQAAHGARRGVGHAEFLRESKDARVEHREALLDLGFDEIRVVGIARGDRFQDVDDLFRRNAVYLQDDAPPRDFEEPATTSRPSMSLTRRGKRLSGSRSKKRPGIQRAVCMQPARAASGAAIRKNSS